MDLTGVIAKRASIFVASSGYRIVPAPKFAQMRSWDCQVCGRAEVKPVFLSGPQGVIAAGSGCAAKLLGYSRPERVKQEYDSVQRQEEEKEKVREERRGRAKKILEHAKTHDIHPTDATHQLGDYMIKTYQAKGRPGEKYPEFLNRVAESGEF